MRIAFYKGNKRLFNRFVSWWTRGPYSHCEAVFSVDDVWTPIWPVYCGSSSFMDGGVRFKYLALDPEHWDVLDVPAINLRGVFDWFRAHESEGYDLMGLLSTSVPVVESKKRWFCNEAVGQAAGLAEAWRFNPNDFACIVEMLPGSVWLQGGPRRPRKDAHSDKTHQPASAGFSL